MLDEVVVSASRSEQKAFDAHGSIDVVNRQTIERSGPQINLSEALGMTPGIFVANRNNLAQDLQVSIRGYGARAPFGVRGVRLMVDGLPQSLPDGQGQTSQSAATSASRIEVLKGPVASLYGNASGGVLQAFTREPSEDPELLLSGFTGSDSLYRSSFQYSDTRGDYGFLVDYGLLAYEGFREYSEAKRSHLNSKLVLKGEDRKTNFIFNVLDQTKGEDPGSRKASEFNEASAFKAPDNNKTNGAGKTYRQSIVGGVHEQRDADLGSFQARAYVSTRDLDNPLPTGRSIFIDRVQWGVGLQNQRDTSFAGVSTKVSLGFEFDHVSDDRQTGQSSVEARRDNVSTGYGMWGQAELFPSDLYSLSAGVRMSSVYLMATNDALNSADTSGGSRRYTGNALYLGGTRHLGETTNLYVTVGTSFETPTLNETLYTLGATNGIEQFNRGIDPARSIQWEIGLKNRRSGQSFAQAAVFGAETKDDIVPQFLSTSNSVWQNTDTRRVGFELSAGQSLPLGLHAGISAQWIKAEFVNSLSVFRRTAGALVPVSVASGNRIPGIPRDRVQAELTWSTNAHKPSVGQPSRYLTLQFVSLGNIDVNSDNSESTDRAQLWNLRFGSRYLALDGEITMQLAIENIADKLYAGSVVVDQAFENYYEPGAPRQYLLGVQYKRTM